MGPQDHVKAILLNSLSKNYSMKTSIYLNLDTLEIEKWNYSFKGITLNTPGVYSKVEFELTKSLKTEDEIKSLSTQLIEYTKQQCELI